MPTIEAMGAIVYRLNSGAMAGLQLLGYVNAHTKASRDEVERQFAAFYGNIQAAIRESGRTDIDWNPIIAEHTLCKVKRLRDCYR